MRASGGASFRLPRMQTLLINFLSLRQRGPPLPSPRCAAPRAGSARLVGPVGSAANLEIPSNRRNNDVACLYMWRV